MKRFIHVSDCRGTTLDKVIRPKSYGSEATLRHAFKQRYEEHLKLDGTELVLADPKGDLVERNPDAIIERSITQLEDIFTMLEESFNNTSKLGGTYQTLKHSLTVGSQETLNGGNDKHERQQSLRIGGLNGNTKDMLVYILAEPIS